MTLEYMLRAIQLARAVDGFTSPNPPVGAVVVKGGLVLGEGSTQPPGGPHAEVVALGAAGEGARGATMYVTLEPCAHWGRTPPCTDAVIAAGIERVHAAVLDPNPLVRGAGVRRLREHGIQVALGDHASEASELIRAHTHYVQTRLPLVTVFRSGPVTVSAHLRRTCDVTLHDAVFVDAMEPPAPGGEGTAPPRCSIVVAHQDAVISDLRAERTGLAPILDRLPSHFTSWQLLLAALGREEVMSILVDQPGRIARALFQHHLVNRVVAITQDEFPGGFTARRAPDGGQYLVADRPLEGTQ